MLYSDLARLRGLSGRDYKYLPLDISASWFPVPANYAFARAGTLLSAAGWTILYLGEAEDMKERMARHERLLEAIGRGATHVLSHTNPLGVDARRAEESDLIRLHNPPMNAQHRTDSLAAIGAMGLTGLGSPFTGFGSLGTVLDPRTR
jgi:hypothetical protein